MRYSSFIKYVFLFVGITIWQACQPKQLVSAPQKVIKVDPQYIYFSDGSKTDLWGKVSSNATVFICVRHTEKALEGDNPDLTPQGKVRARRLADLLQYAQIDKIYSTPTNRTLQTAMPSIERLGCAHGAYRADKLEEFINTQLDYAAGNRFLVVGHSNTTPKIVNHLLQKSVYENIQHHDYDTFYVVVSDGLGKSEAWQLRY